MCGENVFLIMFLYLVIGSPPRVRGKPPLYTMSSAYHRITPACAGKTGNNNVHIVSREDHPRVCGENVLSV